MHAKQRIAFSLGWSLVALIALEVLGGFALMSFYTPTLESAWYTNSQMRVADDMRFLPGLHYWGSTLLIIVSFCLLLYMVFAAMYVGPYRKLWLGTFFVFLGSFLGQINGNLLALDRHDVHTVVIESNIVAGIPGVGSAAKQAMLQGDSFSEKTYLAWMFVHQWVILGLMLFGAAVIGAGLAKSKGASKIVAALPTVAVIALSILVASPNGTSATPADYNGFNADPSWYTWSMHGLLRAFDTMSSGLGWVGAVVIPGLFFLFLFLLPLIGKRVKPSVARPITLVFLAIFIGAGAIYGGKIAAPWGWQDKLPPPRAPRPPRGQRPVPVVVDATLVTQGKELFEKVGCEGCHGIDGSRVESAPDLTAVRTQHTDADWFKRYIRQPSSIDPSSLMPPQSRLTDAELAALAEYLRAPQR